MSTAKITFIEITCNCTTHKARYPTVRVAENLVTTAGLTRETRTVCIPALYLCTLRRGRYSVSIHFSRRVPVCPHFAYNQRSVGGPAPVSQSVGITVSRYPRTSGRYCRASIIGRRRRFYPSELRPSIIRKGRKAGNGRRKDEEEDNGVERPIGEDRPGMVEDNADGSGGRGRIG